MTLDQWLAISKRRSAQLQAWEATQLGTLTAPVAVQLQVILVELAKRYVTQVGSLHARDPDPKAIDDITIWLDGELAAINLGDVAPKIAALTSEPYIHGTVTASLMLGTVLPKAQRQGVVSQDARKSGQLAAHNATVRLDQARSFAMSARSWGGFTLAMAKANQAVTAIKTSAGWAVVAAAVAGVAAYAVSNDARVVVVCQPGACPLCRPHDGEDVTDGGDSPPYHGSCQCTTGAANPGILSAVASFLKTGTGQLAD